MTDLILYRPVATYVSILKCVLYFSHKYFISTSYTKLFDPFVVTFSVTWEVLAYFHSFTCEYSFSQQYIFFVEERFYFACTSRSYSVIGEVNGKSSCKDRGGELLIDLLLMTFSVWFLKEPRTTYTGMAPPTIGPYKWITNWENTL